MRCSPSAPSHTRKVQESRTLGTGDILGTLGGGQERAAHVTLSCWTGVHWAEWVDEGNCGAACISASPEGPVVFTWEGVDPCVMNKPAVSSLCLQSCLCKASTPSLLPAKKDMARMFGNMVYSAEARAGSSTRQGHSKAQDPVQAETGREGLAPGALHWAVRAAGTPVPTRLYRGLR